MIFRRIGAYFFDLGIFLALIVFSYKLSVILFDLNSLFLEIIVVIPLTIVVLFIMYGVISYLLKGSLGKKFFDLKITATNGWLTPVRLFSRDVIGKYLVFIPFAIGLYRWLDRPKEMEMFLRLNTNISLVLIGVLVVANGLMYLVRKELLVDNFFDTNVENDIPTAIEYSDIKEFKDEKKTTRW
ncbi:hypothetical protein RI065_05255 [Mycoplasmatota bacterium zrk1]